MLAALATDLAQIPELHVQVLADHRGLPGPLPGCELIVVPSPVAERALFAQIAADVDWTLVIAPETDDALFDRCQRVEACGGRLLGSASPLVKLLSDKHRTAEHLAAHHVPCPDGIDWRAGSGNILLSSQLVVKPIDGAGSQSTYLVSDQETLDALLAELARQHGPQRSWRVETYRPGEAVSALAICGPAGRFVLPPCYQRMKSGATLTYHGGTYPLPPSLSKRADHLARRAVGSLNESLNEPLGFIGVDMVLGDDTSGGEDFVIEVNPRLTTSYVGLRVASRTNLAQALLDVAAGNRPDLLFDPAPLEFDADGTVRRLECDDSSSLSFSKHADSQSQLADQSTASRIQSGDKSPHSKL